MSESSSDTLLDKPQTNSLKVKFFPSSEGIPDPEDIQGDHKVGLCFSGGGNRSLTSSMGQLRAIEALGKLNKDSVSFISSVSGSTMLNLIYSYRSTSITDADLLGVPVEDMKSLKWWGKTGPTGLNQLNENSVGRTGQRLGLFDVFAEIIKMHDDYGFEPAEGYGRALGKMVFEPFGLYDVDEKGMAKKYLGYTREWLEQEVPANLTEDDFFLMPSDSRPFPIFNSALFPDAMSDGTELVPYELTPIYSGVFPAFPRSGPQKENTGGGYISSYGLGSSSPRMEDAGVAVCTPPRERVSIGDAEGLSGAATAQIIIGSLITKANKRKWYKSFNKVLKDKKGLPNTWDLVRALLPGLAIHFEELIAGKIPIRDLVPNYLYWAVMDLGEKTKTRSTLFADGGQLENTGIDALLRRGTKRIICFNNSESAVGKDKKTGEIIVDYAFSVLFGYTPYEAGKPYRLYSALSPDEFHDLPDWMKPFHRVQIFASEEFETLKNTLYENNVVNGGAALCKQNLKTLENPVLGIKAGQEVSVLWVQNSPVKKWRNSLSKKVRFMMKLNPKKFGDFPNYSTLSGLYMDFRQVNLMAHLGSWTVLSNREIFESMWE